MLALQLLIVIAALPSQDQAQTARFVEEVSIAAKSSGFEQIRKLFTNPANAAPLESMAGSPAGMRTLSVSAFPVPHGFEKFGDYWLVFHRYQGLEAQHDVVYPIVRTGDGPAIGAELPEDLYVPFALDNFVFDIRMNTAQEKVGIETTVDIKHTGENETAVFMRMNNAYKITSAEYAGKPLQVREYRTLGEPALNGAVPTLVRSGGILYLTHPGNGGKLHLKYETSLNLAGLDKTTKDSLLLTSYWYPHIGRRPATSRTRITGPADWLLLSNGNLVSEVPSAGQKTVEFRNDVPLVWFHVVGGPYKLAYETQDRGRKFRAWHVGNVEEARGKHDAEMARDAVAFFEDRFGKFPYNGYDVVDTPDFYGVECYSFTVLTPRITSWATSHEIGHTYFGGLAPNTYIHSIWNESITQYVDSVQFKKNSDQSLQQGYALRNAPVSLTDPFLAHGPYGHVGYFRGAYTMKMLENEIGLEVMNKCLRALAQERIGKVTNWSDIETLFSKHSGTDLSWFFSQWVRGKTFPAISIARALGEAGPRGGWNLNVIMDQTGTPSPFRLRYEFIVQTADGEERFPVAMTQRRQTFDYPLKSKPLRLTVNVFGWSLIEAPSPVKID